MAYVSFACFFCYFWRALSETQKKDLALYGILMLKQRLLIVVVFAARSGQSEISVLGYNAFLLSAIVSSQPILDAGTF